MRPSGISLGFPRLSPSRGQLDYVLLARPPLYSSCDFHVRLACLIHAANVRSEPGSNPSLLKLFVQCLPTAFAAGGWQARHRPKATPTCFHVLTRSTSRPPRMPKIIRPGAVRPLSGAGEGSELPERVKPEGEKVWPQPRRLDSSGWKSFHIMDLGLLAPCAPRPDPAQKGSPGRKNRPHRQRAPSSNTQRARRLTRACRGGRPPWCRCRRAP